MPTENFVIDGITDINSTAFSWNSSWDGGDFMQAVSFWNRNAPGPHRANIDVAGDAWTLVNLRFAGDGGIFANITESGTGAGRRIRDIHLSDAGGRIILDRTEVRTIQSDGPGNTEISLGREGARAILLNEGNDTISINGGNVRFVDVQNGRNSVTLTNDARIETFRSDEGSTTVTMQGESRMFLMKMDRGTNTITTGEGFIEAFYSHEGTNTLNIGAGGGIATMTFSGSNQQQVIRAEGYVGGILAFDDIRVDAVLNGGADSVRLGGGNDRLRTGDDYVGMVNTGRGNDNVSIGSGGAGFVRLGDGDDVISVVPHVPQNGIHIQGGSGIDTVDLSRFGGAVTARLDEYGTWQDVGGGDGYLAFTEIENLIGGIRADSLTGNDDANVLTGGKGNDTLTGLGGNDTFVFNRTSGRDTVTDFAAGEDLIRIAGASGLGALGFRTVGDDVLISFGTARILVEDITVAELRSVDNFMF